MNIEKIFGEELQKIRQEKGLTQEQLAERSARAAKFSNYWKNVFQTLEK